MIFEARKLPTVLNSEEILDKAFGRASKVSGKNNKERAINKLSTISNVLSSYFDRIISSHPSYDALPDFYREMVDVVVGLSKIKMSLASLSWADRMCQKIINKGIRQIKGGKPPEIVIKQVYGRIASIIEDIDDALKFLNEAKNKLKEIPSLSNDFTVVFAGYPNVGKSSIVAMISTTKPEIASYPFTTKKIHVGFIEGDKKERIQIIDTPGLFDRPISKRNRIERRAILALKYLANVIVFVIDPSETCGYPIEKQISLLEEIKDTLKRPVIEIYSKSDLHDFKDRMRVSVKTGEGIDELVKLLKSLVK